MMRHSLRMLVVVAGAALAVACSRKGSDKPTRETVLPLLQKEAQSLKTFTERRSQKTINPTMMAIGDIMPPSGLASGVLPSQLP